MRQWSCRQESRHIIGADRYTQLEDGLASNFLEFDVLNNRYFAP